MRSVVKSKKTINQKIQTIAELDDEIEKFTKKMHISKKRHLLNQIPCNIL